ncbi:MAG: efflux RND transporter periplasmic adaptor subunit [Aureliella sp.]|jgi:RND family efflux transporter MFP subunit
MKRSHAHYSLIAAGFLLGAVLQSGCTPQSQANLGAEESSAAGRPMRVTPITPGRKSLVRTIDLPGRTEAFEVTPLYANVTGYVSSVNVDIGDHVKAPGNGQEGTILCQVVVPELQEQLAEKTAGVDQVKAEVAQAEAGVKLAQAVVASAEARVQEARASAAREEALFSRWQSEYDRVKRLASSGVVTQKVAEETKSEMDAADASRQEVTAKISAVEAQHRETQASLDKAKADLTAEQARLAVAMAEQRRLAAMLAYTTLHAPYDGIVVERRVHTGHLVSAGGNREEGPLLTIMRIDPLRVIVDIPETDAVHVTEKTKVELRVPSLPTQSYVGTISRSSWSLDANSRTLKAEIDLPNPDGQWRPGLYLQAKLTVAELSDVVAIPKSAILTTDKQTYCYVIGPDDRVERRSVALGLQAGSEFQVLSGLDGTERLIGSNPSAFREGQAVEIVPAKPPAT